LSKSYILSLQNLLGVYLHRCFFSTNSSIGVNW